MKVLVTGASGFLGQHLCAALCDEFEVTGTFGSSATFAEDFPKVAARPLDLRDAAATKALVSAVAPDAVVHLAALSSPAVCERNPEEAMAINCPTHLLEALPPRCVVIFLSTDQLYDGLRAPYLESSPAEPVNTYGRSKLAFEAALQAVVPGRWVALRSSLILGPKTPGRCKKQSFLQFCEERLAAGTPTDFFSDEVRSVVWVGDIVEVIIALLRGGVTAEASGAYNMGGPANVTRVDVATAVATALGHPAELVVAVARSSLPAAANAVASPPDISMNSAALRLLTGSCCFDIGLNTALSDMVRKAFA